MTTNLKRDFFLQPTLTVAKRLLGMELVVQKNAIILSGRIVETEAYIGENDPACHACRGRTKRNEIMFGIGGYAYVYFVYGMYNMLNFVTESADMPAAVLIRALEPLTGIEQMRQNRNCQKLTNLTSGPGKLCRAFNIDRSDNGTDLLGNTIFIRNRNAKPKRIEVSARIGVSEGYDKLWRFYDADSKFVSR